MYWFHQEYIPEAFQVQKGRIIFPAFALYADGSDFSHYLP